MLSMKEAIENYVEGCVGKVDCPAYKLFMKAILAGMMIAFGAAGSSVAAHDIANVGLARLVAGVVFPMGLMMVVMTGAELFTGDCLAIMATVQKKHTALKLIRMLVVVYLGNLLGSLMLTCIDYVSGQYNYSSGILGAYTIKVALGKCNLVNIDFRELEAMDDNQEEYLMDLIGFLLGWLSNHILASDKKIGKYIKEHNIVLEK